MADRFFIEYDHFWGAGQRFFYKSSEYPILTAEIPGFWRRISFGFVSCF